MKLAILAPIAWRTPPRHYGPWESVVSALTEGLVGRGVDVTLFATGDSTTGARLVAVCPHGYEEDPTLDPKVWECLHISELFERGDDFDLIHNHFDFLPLTYTAMTRTPVVTTIHGFSSEQILPVYRKYNGKTWYIAISEADRRPELDYVATIHHGIDLRAFSFQPRRGEYLLFLGRIHPDKGTATCVDVARRTGKKLVVAGIVQDRDYFETRVAPHVDGISVTYVGSVGPTQRDDLLGGALALLHPVAFEEPFGLSVVEAMACGTPIIAFARGSMREIVEDGVTGFLVDDVDAMVDAVAKVSTIDRRSCRQHVERHFTVDRMVSAYLAAYRRILQGGDGDRPQERSQ